MSLLIGIEDTRLSATSRARLADKRIAGVILFARNYTDKAQLAELVADIRAVRRGLLIAVDQEGGPVQRFRSEFTALPALARIGALFAADRRAGTQACALHAWLMCHELLALDIDLSLAPVADLARGNRAIGERAFHADPVLNAELVALYVDRMERSGMAATLKHFPGHGSVPEDTHHDVATDRRTLSALAHTDLLPFAVGIQAGARAVMLAHVSYPQVDRRPAGYSRRWIRDLLRHTLRFRGVVMGDDVSMAGAASAGDVADRVRAHYRAGCELVLACQPEAVDAALAARIRRLPVARVKTLRGRDIRWARKVLASSEFADRRTQLEELLT